MVHDSCFPKKRMGCSMTTHVPNHCSNLQGGFHSRDFYPHRCGVGQPARPRSPRSPTYQGHPRIRSSQRQEEGRLFCECSATSILQQVTHYPWRPVGAQASSIPETCWRIILVRLLVAPSRCEVPRGRTWKRPLRAAVPKWCLRAPRCEVEIESKSGWRGTGQQVAAKTARSIVCKPSKTSGVVSDAASIHNRFRRDFTSSGHIKNHRLCFLFSFAQCMPGSDRWTNRIVVLKCFMFEDS